MSVMGYFGRRFEDTRMPKKDGLGIRWEGPVLSGKMGSIEAHQMEAAREAMRKTVYGTRGDERWPRMEDYDVILRAHCGLEGKDFQLKKG